MRLKNAPFVEIAFGCYFLIDALSPRGMPFWQLIYGTLLLFAAFAVFLGLLKNPLLEKNAIPAISLWAVAIASGVLVPITNGARLFESYFFADIAKDAFIFVFLIYFSSSNELRARGANSLTWFLLIAMVLAPCGDILIGGSGALVGTRYDGSGRFEPPHWFLPTLLIARIDRSNRLGWWKWVSIYCVAAGFAILSQQRLNFVQFLAGPVFYYVANRRSVGFGIVRVASVLLTYIVLVATILVQSGAQQFDSASWINRIRLGEVVERRHDTSTTNRFLEVSDVMLCFENRAGLMEAVFGFGYGAVYPAKFTQSTVNVDGRGEVHHIHIGPVQLAFRHGIVGVLVMSSMFWSFSVSRSAINRFDIGSYQLRCGFLAAVFQFCVFGNLHDPLISVLFGWGLSSNIGFGWHPAD